MNKINTAMLGIIKMVKNTVHLCKMVFVKLTIHNFMSVGC